MAHTRASIEAILIGRCGRLLVAAELDGTTVDGTNADLNDPIGWAIRQLGGAVASIGTVADADLAAIADDDTDALLDLAELRTLENTLGNLDLVDIQEGPERQALGQIGARLERAIVRKRAQIERDHGIGLGTITAGVINLGFQQRDCGEL
jgi:hypothetical protein